MKKTLSILIVAAAGLALIGAGCEKKADDTSANTAQNAIEINKAPTPNVVAVTYNPTGLAQKTITVQAGDYVEFRNSDLVPHWPASAPHPTHTDYPELNPGSAIPAGELWRFTATKKGMWKFHDESNPTDVRFQGVLIVQ